MNSHKKIIFSLLFLLVLTAGCVGKPTEKGTDVSVPLEKGGTPAEDFTPYKSDVYTVNRPSAWEVEEHDSFVYFKAPAETDTATVPAQGDVNVPPEKTKDFQENVNVYIVPLKSPNQTLVHFFQDAVEELMETTEGFTVLDHEETTLSGLPAQRIVYTEKINGQKIQYLQVFAIKDGKGYVLTYTAPAETYSTYVKDAEAMINSFNIP